RNRFVFDNSYTAPCGVLESVNRVLSSCLLSNVTPPSPLIDTTDDKRWVPPAFGLLKLNTDTAK
ncbi:hypothetical protein PanWU01x14_216850, partial [Parasponia andersonii]